MSKRTQKNNEKMPSEMMSGIQKFISDCPALSFYLETLQREVGVNYLDEPQKNYSIEQEPVEPWVKRYADGTGIKRCTFVFSSREPYGKDVIDALVSCGFYDALCDWIEKQDRVRIYPEIGEDKKVTKMKVNTTPYVFDTTETTAKYQVSIELNYYQK